MTEFQDAIEGREHSFRILCDLASLHRSCHGAIIGDIYVELDGVAFPERKWSDFVVTVLGWWVTATRQFGHGASAVDLMFMDGPFVVRITAVNGANCAVELLQRSLTTSRIAHAGSVSVLEIIQQAEQVAAKVVELCVESRWQSPDLEKLRSLLRAPRN